MTRETDFITKYHNLDLVRRRVEVGEHRDVIGGMWDELGTLQHDFLVDQGLKPHHRLVDIGCGSLRAGVPLTRYLDADRYYGIDISRDLLDAGYEREILPAGLGSKLPPNHLHATADWDVAPFGVRFDFGLAQSVFTHLPRGQLTDCLSAIAPHFVPGGRVYITYFHRPDDCLDGDPVIHEPGGIASWHDRDPFDIRHDALSAATPEGWDLTIIGEWGHPRDQRMALFTRR